MQLTLAGKVILLTFCQHIIFRFSLCPFCSFLPIIDTSHSGSGEKSVTSSVHLEVQ